MKFYSKGDCDRARMRLTPRGYQARMGLENSQFGTFSPVARKKSIFGMLCLTAMCGLLTRCVDITKAFLYGLCKEEVYVKVPDGFMRALTSNCN